MHHKDDRRSFQLASFCWWVNFFCAGVWPGFSQKRKRSVWGIKLTNLLNIIGQKDWKPHKSQRKLHRWNLFWTLELSGTFASWPPGDKTWREDTLPINSSTEHVLSSIRNVFYLPLCAHAHTHTYACTDKRCIYI